MIERANDPDLDYYGPEELPLSLPEARFTETQLSSLDVGTRGNERKAEFDWYEDICQAGMHVTNKHLPECPYCNEGR